MAEDSVQAHRFFGADKAASSPPALVSAHAMGGAGYGSVYPALECRMRSEEVFPETQLGFLSLVASYSFNRGVNLSAIIEGFLPPPSAPGCHPCSASLAHTSAGTCGQPRALWTILLSLA